MAEVILPSPGMGVGVHLGSHGHTESFVSAGRFYLRAITDRQVSAEDRAKTIVDFEQTKMIKHKNIAPFTKMLCDCNSTYLLRPYIEGVNLGEYLEEERTFSERVTVLKDIAMGLHYLHSMNILCKSLKPQNIIVGADGHATIVDVGVDFLFQEYISDPKSLLSFLHIGPDGVLNDHARPTVELDLYHFGLVSYLTFFGKYPYSVLNAGKIIRDFTNDMIPIPRQEESKECGVFISRFLCSDATKRMGMADAIKHLESMKPNKFHSTTSPDSERLTRIKTEKNVSYRIRH